MSDRFHTLDDIQLKDKTVLMRVDINSTIDLKRNEIIGRERFRQLIPSIKEMADSKLVLLAHQSRAGNRDCTKLSLHRDVLEEVIGRPVKYVEDLIGAEARREIKALKSGEILLLENTRLYAEENAFSNRPPRFTKDTYIVSNIAPLCDLFVFDAFAAAHRSQPSLNGFTEVLPSAAGRLMEKEIDALGSILLGEKKPMAVVLGGVKIDDSIEIAQNLLASGKADKLLVTGLVANVFLVANGIDLGKRNLDILRSKTKNLDRYIEIARNLIFKYPYQVFMPDDVAVDNNGAREDIFIDDSTEMEIKDLGCNTIEFFCEEIRTCKSVMLNGPAGVFEKEEFAIGTEKIFRAASEDGIFAVMGGGETTVAIDRYGLRDGIEHISTGGGAAMTFLAGRDMPVLNSLKANMNKFKLK